MGVDERLRRSIERIAVDKQRGAAALVREAAVAVAEWLQRLPPGYSALKEAIREVSRQLVAAQPTMAPFVQLANQLLWAAELAPPGNELHAIREALEAFSRRMESQVDRIFEAIADRLSGCHRVFTYSYSSVVLAVMARLAHRTAVEVLCTEGRPVREGVLLASELARLGIPVRLGVDAAALQLVAESDVVLIGADAVTPTHLYNKQGTTLLVLAARHLNRPAYCLCGTEKLVPKGYSLPPEASKDPREVLEHPIPGVQVVNFYFEATPLELVSGLATDQGFFRPEEVSRLAAFSELHPALAQSGLVSLDGASV